MNKQVLHERLEALEKKIADFKEHRDFEEHYNDGHKRTVLEIERHQKELHDKIQKDIHDSEEAHGQLSMLEEQMIILMNSL